MGIIHNTKIPAIGERCIRAGGFELRIIPVIDVMEGIVVRAIAGRRERYLPLRSQLTRSAEPFDVARALLDATGAKELYVADLDGLMRGEPQPGLRELAERLGVEVWLDVGLKCSGEWKRTSKTRPIIATETFEQPIPPPVAKRGDLPPTGRGRVRLQTTFATPQPDSSPLPVGGRPTFEQSENGGWGDWTAVQQRDFFTERPIISLDYRDGRLLSHHKLNPGDFPTVIVLDTAAVGLNQGPCTVPQCIEIRQQYPHLDLITGGGIRNADDLKQLEDIGVNGVLIASALHDGVTFPPSSGSHRP